MLLRAGVRAAIAALGVLSLTAVAAVPNTREPTVRVPALRGLTRPDASERLRKLGLRAAAYSGSIRYEPLQDGFRRRIDLVPVRRARPRRVTIQAPSPGFRAEPGSAVTLGTQPVPDDYRYSVGIGGGSLRRPNSVSVARGGRRLTLGLQMAAAGCGPLDHVDLALRERWVLLTPFAIGGEGGRACNGRSRYRHARLRLPEPLKGRPILEGPPIRPNPALVNQHATRFESARPSPNGRSVVVYFTFGACVRLAGSRVKERAKAVEITLIQGDDGTERPCPSIALSGLTVVHLRSPLDERRIVDGAR